jgi:hypothetical protein
MNEMSLSRIYKLLASKTAHPLQAEDDLARMLRALQPESEALAADVARLQRPAHPLRARAVRVAGDARRGSARPLRWVGSLAACLALVVGVFALRGQQEAHWNNVTAAAGTAALPDRIFTSNDVIFASSDHAARRPIATSAGDEVFHTDFSAGG